MALKLAQLDHGVGEGTDVAAEEGDVKLVRVVWETAEATDIETAVRAFFKSMDWTAPPRIRIPMARSSRNSRAVQIREQQPAAGRDVAGRAAAGECQHQQLCSRVFQVKSIDQPGNLAITRLNLTSEQSERLHWATRPVARTVSRTQALPSFLIPSRSRAGPEGGGGGGTGPWPERTKGE